MDNNNLYKFSLIEKLKILGLKKVLYDKFLANIDVEIEHLNKNIREYKKLLERV